PGDQGVGAMITSFMSVIAQAIVWVCVGLFIATAVITVRAYAGRVPQLGGGDGSQHDYYLKRLLLALLVELLAIAMATYAAYFADRWAAPLDPQVTVSPTNPIIPLPGGKLFREAIEAKAYATSDGPKSSTVTVPIPSNATYVTHEVKVWT